MKQWIKAIIILPFNVTVTIPFLILYFAKYQYIIPSITQIILGIILFVFGLSIVIWTMVLFHKIGKGTLAPWAATKNLVTEGPFKISRNPMITGVLFILASEALILNSINLFYWMIIFFIINCIYFKLFEEKQLERNFGKEYLEYKKQVPMWLPKFSSIFNKFRN